MIVAFHHNAGVKAATSLGLVSLGGRVSNAIELRKRVNGCLHQFQRLLRSKASRTRMAIE